MKNLLLEAGIKAKNLVYSPYLQNKTGLSKGATVLLCDVLDFFETYGWDKVYHCTSTTLEKDLGTSRREFESFFNWADTMHFAEVKLIFYFMVRTTTIEMNRDAFIDWLKDGVS
jgi:hypothetical protein